MPQTAQTEEDKNSRKKSIQRRLNIIGSRLQSKKSICELKP